MAMYGRMFSIGRNESYDRGLRLFDQGLYEAAIPELEKVVDISDQDNTILVRLANFYLAECWSFLGSYALGQRLFERSTACFHEALARNPGYADLHCKLATVYYLDNNFTEADKELDVALAINPKYGKALVQSCLCKYQLGQPDAAIAAVTKAVESNPPLDHQKFEEGLAVHNAGDYNTALSIFSGLIVSDIDEVAYHARLGADFFKRGMLDEASAEFESAIRINSTYADLHNSLGVTYHSAGKYAFAAAEFRKALTINPNYDEAGINLDLSLNAAAEAGESVVHLELIDDEFAGERGSTI
jgi:tetratricopeptide (TPR) repeat protein